MTKMKTTEIPNRAKNLFIQLYCEKRGGQTYENLHSATQSWLSLSLSKKKCFYDTISTKSAVKKAQLIIQTEPYLRAKFPSIDKRGNEKSTENKSHQKNVETGSDHTAPDNRITSVHDDTTMECDSNSYAEDHNVNESFTYRLETESIVETCVLEQVQNEPEINNAQKEQNSYTSVLNKDSNTADEFDKRKNAEKAPLIEPVLPIAKTGKELFYLLKARHGDNKTYEFLTTKEKRVYGRAVNAIKADYVKKYKEYLESLTPRQLFDCYKKIF